MITLANFQTLSGYGFINGLDGVMKFADHVIEEVLSSSITEELYSTAATLGIDAFELYLKRNPSTAAVASEFAETALRRYFCADCRRPHVPSDSKEFIRDLANLI